MKLCDFSFYQNTYKGIAITNEDDFNFYAEQGALYILQVLPAQSINDMAKRCNCRIADILYSFKDVANGAVKSGETIGKYSVSYGAIDQKQIDIQIANAIKLYIGNRATGGAIPYVF